MSSLCKNFDFKYTHSMGYATRIKTKIKFTDHSMDPKHETSFNTVSDKKYTDKDVTFTCFSMNRRQ